MFSNVGVWFIGLTKIGKASVIGSAVAGSMVVGAVASPTPEPAPAVVPASVQQVVQEPVVTTKVKTESRTIAFEKQTVNDGSLTKGVKQVRTVGVDGVKTITHTITLTDGVETARDSSEKVTTAPVTQVTAVGTYMAPKPAPSPAAASNDGVVKMSRSSICHAPGTTYYARTKNYVSYSSLEACLNAGGRMPKR